MKAILDNIKREPALVTTFVAALLLLLVEAGVPISDGLQRAIQGVILAGMAIIIRQQVTPAGEVAAQRVPSGEVVSGPADGVRPDGTPVVVQPVEQEETELEEAPVDYVGEHRGPVTESDSGVNPSV